VTIRFRVPSLIFAKSRLCPGMSNRTAGSPGREKPRESLGRNRHPLGVPGLPDSWPEPGLLPAPFDASRHRWRRSGVTSSPTPSTYVTPTVHVKAIGCLLFARPPFDFAKRVRAPEMRARPSTNSRSGVGFCHTLPIRCVYESLHTNLHTQLSRSPHASPTTLLRSLGAGAASI